MDVYSTPEEGFLRDITKLVSFGISFFIFLRGGGDGGVGSTILPILLGRGGS